MKKILFITFIILLVPSYVLATPQDQALVPANVKVFVNDQQILFTEEPKIVNNALTLPLREIAESLDITVIWKNTSPNQVLLIKGDKELAIPLNSKKILYDRKVSFMEQTPILINGHTMVSLRFITTILGVDLTQDENRSTVNIADNGNFAELPSAKDETEENADNYYKWYDVLIGPDSGPNPEEAKNYVLKQGLLTEVKDIQRTYIRFTELGDSVTMVSGIDKDNQEKLIWLGKNKYVGDIFVSGTALKNSGLSQETVISILQEKGINEASIINLYIAPYDIDEIVWFIIAEKEGKQYFYCLDFFNGAILVENTNEK